MYQGFSYYFCLMIEGSWAGSGSIPLTNGSGSGRPKNMWIRIWTIASLSSLLRHKVVSDAELRNPHNGGSVILGLGSTDLAYLGRIFCVLSLLLCLGFKDYFVNVTPDRQLIPSKYSNLWFLGEKSECHPSDSLLTDCHLALHSMRKNRCSLHWCDHSYWFIVKWVSLRVDSVYSGCYSALTLWSREKFVSAAYSWYFINYAPEDHLPKKTTIANVQLGPRSYFSR